MLSVTSNGKTVNYAYDANGNLLTETGNDHSVTNTYNKANLPVTKVNKKNGTEINRYSMAYDLSGDTTYVTDSVSDYSRSYIYDNAGRLFDETTRHGRDGETNIDMMYGYDKLGNRIWNIKLMMSTADQYYEYEYHYGNYNQLEQVNIRDNSDVVIEFTNNYTYDSNGNLSGKTKTNASEEAIESSTYTFNNGGRMTQSTKDGVVTTYTYDGDGLRMSKTTNGVTTSFILDGADVVAEIKGSEITVYSRGLGLFAQTKGTTTKTYFSNDHGDVTGLFSSATNGEEALYDGFGITVFNDSEDNPFGYCGEYYDEETGLIYLRARYYDPEIGRFISEDPIMDGTNWYVYCSNNPVMFVDPWGREYIVVSGGAYDTNGGYDYEFIEPAIKKLRELIDLNDGENITWIVTDEGWSDIDKDRFQLLVDTMNGYLGANVSLKMIGHKDELINYINNKNGDNSRANDKIKKFVLFSHGWDGTISLGYNYSTYNMNLNLNISDISKISGNAFDNPNSAFYSCNTGTSGSNSFAQKWVNRVGGKTWALVGKSDYASINQGEDWTSKVSRWNFGFSFGGSKNYPIAGTSAVAFGPWEGQKPFITTFTR